MFSPLNKIHREVGRAKDLSAPRYSVVYLNLSRSLAHKSSLAPYSRTYRHFATLLMWDTKYQTHTKQQVK